MQQLLPRSKAKNTPTLAQLTHAFHIETVGRQFFEAYKEQFLHLSEAISQLQTSDPRLRNEFQRLNIHIPDFAKKLLGQIVFLYFIQKKGWLGVSEGEPWGNGPRDFLRRLFAQNQQKNGANFFDEILEPLFYDALAIQREGDWFAPVHGRIPFLNGGLFEPMHSYDWRYIPPPAQHPLLQPPPPPRRKRHRHP